MKINKIILVSLILIILTLGAVSASDNTAISDNVTSPQDADIIEDDDDDDYDYTQYNDGSGTVKPNVVVYWPNELRVGDDLAIRYNIPEDMESNVVLFINNERVDDGQEAVDNDTYDVFIDEFGTNNIKFKFFGDDKYAPITLQKTYNVKDFKFDVEIDDENLTYGQEPLVSIDLPFDATGYVKIGSVKYMIDDDDVGVTAPLKNLQLGTNQVQITYSGDDKYPSKTKTVNVEVKAQVQYSTSMPFDNVTFFLRLPSDAAGRLEVTVDDVIKISKLSNGYSEIKFEGLTLGVHNFKTRYLGDDYSCIDYGVQQFEVAPAIKVNSFKSTHDENSVEIRLPEGETGILEVKAHRYSGSDYEIEIDEISKSSNVSDGSSISLSTLKPGLYKYELRYISDNGHIYSTSVEGFVRDKFAMNMTVDDIVMADEESIDVYLDFLFLNLGIIEIYIDGEFYDDIECVGSSSEIFTIEESLSVGNHTITANFLGNELYAPLERSAETTSTFFMIYVPEEIVLDVDDVISIDLVQNATGDLVVYVDGVEFARKRIQDGYASINMANLPFGIYSVIVAYENGNYPATSQSLILNVSYTFNMVNETTSYAGDDLYIIEVPEGLSVDDLVVKIDDVEVPIISNGSHVGINVSGLDMGDHVITVSHPGDGTFYPLSIEKTIEVSPTINIPSEMQFGDEKFISLVLPKDPQGLLSLAAYDQIRGTFVDKGTFQFTPFGNNSIAEIPLSTLGIGDHKIKVGYTGTDYDIPEKIMDVSVNLDLKFDREIQYSKKLTVTVNLPNAEGFIEIMLDDEYVNPVKFVNGVAKIEFKGLQVGQHQFELMYDGDSPFDFEGMFLVCPIISVPTGTVIDGSKSITLNSGSEPLGTIIVYADGKKYKEIDLEGGKQSISLGGLANGVHKLSILYDSWDGLATEKNYTVTTKKASITAKDMKMFYRDGSKFKVLVKDYKGKAVKKGQKVKFYVDGKLFKTVKTDKKGYASVVLTHAPGTHKVKAVYKATSLTKKVTVKQVVTLKKVTVKKSAKKLGLTATLKKVKGKSVKNQKITFKFNGKKYRAVTNSKGVAKVTIPGNVLKKLKVGKKITYQATYIKATAKQSVKVSK